MKLTFKTLFYSLITISIATFSSCKKDDTSSDETGAIDIHFENVVGSQSLVLNTQSYQNANGDDFKISTFKYYVSNVILIKSDRSEYKVPENYFLMDAATESSLDQSIDSIPAGDYTSMKFTIGVDSIRNFAGAQTGNLDPAKGMFWSWKSGYIFVKLEGTSSKSTATNNKLTFHIGGAIAPNNTIRQVTQTFSSPLRIRKNSAPELHFIVDAAYLFKGRTTVNFATLNFTMGGANSVIVADNYATGMFRLDHIHN